MNNLDAEVAERPEDLVVYGGTGKAARSWQDYDRIIASLTKYGIDFSEDESDEALRSRLADFYARRTLTGTPVTPDDQAEAIFYLLSGKASKTTGQILSVDGGLHEAFVR